jgi:S1-C subfamily serine protease
MILQILAVLLLITTTLAGTVYADKSDDAGAASLVQLIVTFQESDPVLPWQKRQPSVRAGYGVVIAPNILLTTENLIRQHRLIEMRRPRSGNKIPVRVIVSDEQVNLALLEIRQPERAAGLVPMALADDVGRGDPTEILQMDETSQLQRGDGHILQIMMAPLPRAPYSSLTFTMLTDLNVNGEGAPILAEKRLAGLVMSYDRSSRIGWMIPHPVLTNFLAMAMKPPYAGFASAGFTWMALVDPVKRRHLGVKDNDKGIIILSYLPEAGTNQALLPDDVVIEWDGQPVDNMGFYTDPVLGRLDMSWLIKGHRKPGDTINVKIIRNRVEQTVTLVLKNRRDSWNLVPDDITGEPVEYLVHGGFLIRELSGRYLQAYGTDWRRTADPRLVNLYLTRRMAPDFPGQRVVILSAVLPDPINVGYQFVHDQVITHVNGKAVASMKDVFRVFDADGGIQRMSIQSSGVDIVIDADTVRDANLRMVTTYGIPSLRYSRPQDSRTIETPGVKQ